MKYLSFDLECCDGRHICEFGYVLYDEGFCVLERGCVTVNPEKPFKLSGRNHDSDITLAFTEEEYYASPTFPFYYEKIKALLKTPDCQIIGFGLSNDVKFLRTAYERYGLAFVPFEYFDFQKLYRFYTKSTQLSSLENIVKTLEISELTMHKSVDDSDAIRLCLKAIGEKEGLPLPQTIEKLCKANKGYRIEEAREKSVVENKKRKKPKA